MQILKNDYLRKMDWLLAYSFESIKTQPINIILRSQP